MSGKGLSPSVEDAEKADLSAEMFWISRNGLESFGRSPEQ
jgi:hypothetical protein